MGSYVSESFELVSTPSSLVATVAAVDTGVRLLMKNEFEKYKTTFKQEKLRNCFLFTANQILGGLQSNF